MSSSTASQIVLSLNVSTNDSSSFFFISTQFNLHHSQLCVHTNASTISGVNELRKGSSIHPSGLKADSDTTVETCTANTSLAIVDKILVQFDFHQCKIENVSSPSQVGSNKYRSISFLTSSTTVFPCAFLN